MRLCIFKTADSYKIAINPEKIILIKAKSGFMNEKCVEICAEDNVGFCVNESLQTVIDKVIGGKRE